MQQKIAKNKRNTFLIMAGFMGIIGALGWIVVNLMGANVSMLYGVIGISLVFVLFQYFFADKLAIKMSGAVQITRDDNPRLWGMVEKLAGQTDMPMPRLYIIHDPAPNAFATGRNPRNAAVAATTGIMEIMDDRQLEAVLAHEISHVRNYDIRVSMIAFGLTSVISVLADFMIRMTIFGGDEENETGPLGVAAGIVLMILAPIAAMLIQMAISRQREYLADASGAHVTNDPEGLAQALEKLQRYSQPMLRQNTSTAHLYIANPLKSGMLARLFSTHPPLEERVARLRGVQS